jgi:hypothetical protein
MSDNPTPDEAAIWQRRLASQANNRAWTLSESVSRTAEDDEEMLHAAHAAMFFWQVAGNRQNRARAALLLAHVHALLNMGMSARHYESEWQRLSVDDAAEQWEVAIAHAVAANVAAANKAAEAHREHYAEARRTIDSLPNDEDRAILEATLRVVPVPAGYPGGA